LASGEASPDAHDLPRESTHRGPARDGGAVVRNICGESITHDLDEDE
jgi:hypothetical protein